MNMPAAPEGILTPPEPRASKGQCLPLVVKVNIVNSLKVSIVNSYGQGQYCQFVEGLGNQGKGTPGIGFAYY